MKPDPILSLYHAAEHLQRACQALELAGNTDGAQRCRDAAVSTMQAIAAAVKQRTEDAKVAAAGAAS